MLEPRGTASPPTRQVLFGYADLLVQLLPSLCRHAAHVLSSDKDGAALGDLLSRASVFHVCVAAECFAVVQAGAAEDLDDVRL